MAEHTAIGAGGLGSILGPVKADSVDNSSPVLPRRLAAEMGPATGYTLQRNTASIMKSFFRSFKNIAGCFRFVHFSNI